MNKAEDFFLVLQVQVNIAEQLRNEFDQFWRTDVGSRSEATITYLIRHTALLSSFENLLFMFCSREVWTYGGMGAKALKKGFDGPIYLLSNGDAIDKMRMLCGQFEKEVKDILGLFSLPAELDFLENEINHIKKVNALALNNFETIHRDFVYDGL
ncbi:hypothetical protein [Pedobacter mendelii]|uniref:DinB family protein n=1 Tax=Pedobacter mendelii TaxID=1908240 RepID=A0ABQ2BLJ1_9SPHI|nr:hypothetical protein [Pedobacter mendelii]GGI29103.1 hypothetical protein GCM10008119_35960 [Pedobacter mendelii]